MNPSRSRTPHRSRADGAFRRRARRRPRPARARRARAHGRAPLASQICRPRRGSRRCCELLFACALSAPSKSDLQQADIVHVADRAKIKSIADGIPDMPWIANAPVFLVFCGNNRRIRQIGEWRGKPFANEHLDHFMNAAVDAGIVMTSFIRAAEAVGLGCCPISAVRNHPEAIEPPAGTAGRRVPGRGPVRRLSRRGRTHHAAPVAAK